MGEKDILEKKLLMFNDVFAEFINGIMFDGKEVVKEDELTDLAGWSYYKINLIDLKKLSEDDITKFKKDFKVLVDYLVNGSAHTSDAVELNHPEEISELILRLTGESLSIPKGESEGGNNMEKFFEPMFERVAERGRAEGRAEGRVEGKAEGETYLAKLISLLLSEGRNDILKDVLENEQLRHGLYKEYGIQ